jgi:hypothetical protein
MQSLTHSLSAQPNYFGEWCCWLGFVISALPSLCTVCATTVASTPPAPVAAASKTLWFDLFARLHAKITNSPSATAAATTTPMWVCCGLGLGLIYTLRLFYDCLVHWTGAAPSEHFSAAKRPVFSVCGVACGRRGQVGGTESVERVSECTFCVYAGLSGISAKGAVFLAAFHARNRIGVFRPFSAPLLAVTLGNGGSL